MFIWADNLADSHVLILGNLKPHNRRLSIEGPFAFATQVGRQRWKVVLVPTVGREQKPLCKCQLLLYWVMARFP